MAEIKISSVNITRIKWFSLIFWITLFIIVLFALLYKLNSWPNIFWDEGWTLDAARNWVVDGHLGHYLDNQPVPPRIPVRFTEVVLVAAGMKLFGIGTWQGRIPIVITSILSLGLIYYLCLQIFNKKIGVASLLYILLFSVFIYHPFVIGRQVMAEMPMMFFLLGGYSFLWLALTRKPVWIIGSALLFGFAIQAKLQVPPFLLVSISLALISSIILKQRKSTFLILLTAAGSIAVFLLVFLIQNQLMPGSFNDSALLKILFNSVIFVLDKNIRIQAALHVFLFGLPLVLSFLWSGWRIVQHHRNSKDQNTSRGIEKDMNRIVILTSIWGLGASWLIWYLFMSVTYIRYLFPPFFIGSIFVGQYLHDLTDSYDFRVFVKDIYSLIIKREYSASKVQSLILLFALCIGCSSAILSYKIGLDMQQDDSILASTYMRDNIPFGSRVETFESELLFLAPQYSYHFPSDLVSMEAQRRYIDPEYPIEYNPLESKPEYIIIGPMGHLWPIYNDVIIGKYSHLVADIGNYQIYRIGDGN